MCSWHARCPLVCARSMCSRARYDELGKGAELIMTRTKRSILITFITCLFIVAAVAGNRFFVNTATAASGKNAGKTEKIADKLRERAARKSKGGERVGVILQLDQAMTGSVSSLLGKHGINVKKHLQKLQFVGD